MAQDTCTREQYLTRHGVSSDAFADPAMHVMQRRMSPGQYERLQLLRRERHKRLEAVRVAVEADYEAKLASGEIRKPTRRERLERIASGHPDNAAVQAARRLLAAMESI